MSWFWRNIAINLHEGKLSLNDTIFISEHVGSAWVQSVSYYRPVRSIFEILQQIYKNPNAKFLLFR